MVGGMQSHSFQRLFVCLGSDMKSTFMPSCSGWVCLSWFTKAFVSGKDSASSHCLPYGRHCWRFEYFVTSVCGLGRLDMKAVAKQARHQRLLSTRLHKLDLIASLWDVQNERRCGRVEAIPVSIMLTQRGSCVCARHRRKTYSLCSLDGSSAYIHTSQAEGLAGAGHSPGILLLDAIAAQLHQLDINTPRAQQQHAKGGKGEAGKKPPGGGAGAASKEGAGTDGEGCSEDDVRRVNAALKELGFGKEAKVRN